MGSGSALQRCYFLFFGTKEVFDAVVKNICRVGKLGGGRVSFKDREQSIIPGISLSLDSAVFYGNSANRRGRSWGRGTILSFNH